MNSHTNTDWTAAHWENLWVCGPISSWHPHIHIHKYIPQGSLQHPSPRIERITEFVTIEFVTHKHTHHTSRLLATSRHAHLWFSMILYDSLWETLILYDSLWFSLGDSDSLWFSLGERMTEPLIDHWVRNTVIQLSSWHTYTIEFVTHIYTPQTPRNI